MMVQTARVWKWLLSGVVGIALAANGIVAEAVAGDEVTYATLGNAKITSADVDLQLGRTAANTASLPAVPENIVMATVDLIAKQKRALATLTKQKKRIPDADLDKWLVENTPADIKLTADAALNQRAEAVGLSPAGYKDFLAFRFSWQAFIQQQVNEKNLTRHFNNQKKRFDGSRFRIQHCFVAVPPGESSQRKRAHEVLSQVRERLNAGTNSLADVVAKSSDGLKIDFTKEPLWITGAGPVLPAVIDVALKQKPEEWSQVFDSGQGVHLVRVDEVEEGSRTQAEAGEELRRHMLLYLLDFLAQQSEKDLPLVWKE